MSRLYGTYSLHFQRKLSLVLSKSHGLHQVEQWFHTADGIIIPLLLLAELMPYERYDSLTHCVMENCANNYAQFVARVKRMKKLMRKSYALHGDFREVPKFRDLSRIQNEYEALVPTNRSPLAIQALVCVTQTRAFGLADTAMANKSLKTFVETITEKPPVIKLEARYLHPVTAPAARVTGTAAKLSAGPKACLERSQEKGGQTAQLAHIVKTYCVNREWNFRTLESTPKRRIIRTPEDVLTYGLETLRSKNSWKLKIVRATVIREPSKARIVTVSPYPTMCLFHMVAHLFKGVFNVPRARSGMKGTRHLWDFLWKNLHPQNSILGDLEREGKNLPVYALSLDLETATDFGNPEVARQILMSLTKYAHHNVDGFPTGLVIQVINLFCGPRMVLVQDGSNYRYHLKKRGWFMGDPMTKLVLTAAQLYCFNLSGLKTASCVGDDLIALHHDQQRLWSHVETLRNAGFKVSMEDTYVSNILMYYCEEVSKVPQNIKETLVSQTRNQVPLGYVDYPRIRLLLPINIDGDRISYTNLGRFEALGKEVIWTCGNNPRLLSVMIKATLIQHILIPKDADTLCPFFPSEMGGDGAYHPNKYFVGDVIERKSRDPYEVRYRASQMRKGIFSHRLLRSDRTNQVTHKHHMWAPIRDQLKQFIPADSIIEPETKEHQMVLASIRSRTLDDPMSAIMRIMKSAYFRSVLRGKVPEQANFKLDRIPPMPLGGKKIEAKSFDLQGFLHHWRNPGFSFKNLTEYFINTEKLEIHDYMNLGWKYNPPIPNEWDKWVKENLDTFGRGISSVQAVLIDTIGNPLALPDLVRSQLHQYMESDNLILYELYHNPIQSDWEEFIILISNDVKLARRIVELPQSNGVDVYVLPPRLYLSYPHLIPFEIMEANGRTIEDPGAIMHEDLVYQTDGQPHFEPSEVIVKTDRHQPRLKLVQEVNPERIVEKFRPRRHGFYSTKMHNV